MLPPPSLPQKQALKWAKRAVDEEAQIGLRVSNVLLFPKAAQSLANSTGSRKVAVRIALPAALSETLAADLAATDPTAPWITPAARLVGGKITYDTDLPNADAHAGSAVHAALLALMDAASSARLSGEVEVEAAASEVLVQIVLLGEAAAGKAASSAGKQSRSASAADKEKILGVARFSLTDMLEGGHDLEAGAPLSLWASEAAALAAADEAPAAAAAAASGDKAADKAAATAIAKAEAAGQLGVVAITTKMAHALKIVSRQLRARRTFDVRRAAARMGYGNTPGASPATTPSSRGGALAASGGGTRTRWASSSLSSSLPSAEIEPIRQAGIAAGVARSYSCAPAVPVRTTAATMESARPLAASNAMNAFAAAAGGGGTKPAGRRATVAASVVGDLEDD